MNLLSSLQSSDSNSVLDDVRFDISVHEEVDADEQVKERQADEVQSVSLTTGDVGCESHRIQKLARRQSDICVSSTQISEWRGLKPICNPRAT